MKRVLLILAIFGAIITELYAQETKIKKIELGGRGANNMAPFVLDSVLYFSSNRKSSWLVHQYDQNKQSLYKIYTSNLLKDSSFDEPKNYRLDEVSEFTIGSIIFTPDGDTMYVTKNHYDSYKRSRSKKIGTFLGVYSAVDNSNGSYKVKSLDFNEKKSFNAGQPTLTPDGNTMFFVTDDRYGRGKSDIYYATRIDGEWSDAVNLDTIVNTEGNEVFPFYHPSGKLLFASDGHGGKGGLDIFYTIKTDSGWVKPMIYDEALNSGADDFGCFISEDESWGVITSNRGGRSDNLFRFDVEYPQFRSCEPQVEDSYCYTLFENSSYRADDLPLIYSWDFGDGGTAKGDTVNHCFPHVGSFHIKLDVLDTLTNEELYTVAEYDVDIKPTEQVYISCADTIKVGEEYILNASNSYLGNLVVGAFFWELEDGSRQKGERIKHVFKETGKFEVKCGVVSKGFPQVKKCSSKEIIVIE